MITLFNRELPKTIKPNEAVRVQVAPFGEYAQTAEDGTQIVQKCDEAAFREIVKRWEDSGKPDILVDYDHRSETGGSTEAAAWATNLAVEDGGLFADFVVTDAGADALSSVRYRYLSPCWTVDMDTGRPNELLSVGLTNRPNLPVARLLNSSAASAEAQHTPETKTEINEGTPSMDKLRELLGLAAEATEDDIYAAVDALRAERDKLKAERAEREAAELEAEANACVKERAGDIDDKDAVVNAFKAAPEVARVIFANLKKRTSTAPVETPAPRVVNSAEAQTPKTLNSLADCKTPEERIAWAIAADAASRA